MRLYLVRHGETDANQQGVYYGRYDIPLVESGIKQSEALAKTLATISFDRIITSSLQRTKQTAQIIRGDDSVNIEARAEFDELDFGDWEGRHYQQLMQHDHERYSAWCNDWINQAPPAGESFQQFSQRVKCGLEQLLATIPEQGVVLFVGHQGVLRVIMLLLLKMKEEAFWHFTFQQGAYSVIEIVQGHTVVQAINRS